MKRLAIFIIVLVGIGWIISLLSKDHKPLGSINNGVLMQISSNAFASNGTIPDTYTCAGKNVNPPLSFSGVSSDARSLALILDDPSAPSGIYTHWVIYNIPPSTKEILQDSQPPGIVAQNSAGVAAYTGPCPTSGEHLYHFKLYALDSLLTNVSIKNKAALLDAMSGHILDQAELLGKVSGK